MAQFALCFLGILGNLIYGLHAVCLWDAGDVIYGLRAVFLWDAGGCDLQRGSLFVFLFLGCWGLIYGLCAVFYGIHLIYGAVHSSSCFSWGFDLCAARSLSLFS